MQPNTYQLSLFGESQQSNVTYVTKADIKDVPWSELREIFLNYAHSPQLFKPGGKSSEFGLGMPSLYFLDIDQDCTLDQAKKAFQGYQHIIYTSRNHQKVKETKSGLKKPACDRFRVVLALESPIQDKETWEATSVYVENEFGIINDPQLHFWMFFFAGTEIVSYQEEGKKLKPLAAKDLADYFKQESSEGGVPHWKEYYIDGKGVLSKVTRLFLMNGAPFGEFNSTLFKAAADARDQGYTENEFIHFWNRSKFPKKEGSLAFDDTDLNTVRNVFSKAPQPNAQRLPTFERSGKKAGRPRKEYTEESMQHLAEVMSRRFLLERKPELTVKYEILNPEKKEVRLFQNDDIVDRYIEQERKKDENSLELLRHKVPSGDFEIADLATWREIWRLKGEEVNKVEPFLMPDEDGYTLKKLDFTLSPGLYPAWREFLDRLSSPETFMAWVGSCFDRKNRSRQALWLYGPRGEDGKTTIIKVLGRIFGEASGALTGSQIGENSRFFLSNFYKKWFVVYPDCKMPSFVRHELFRNMTSGDPVIMEFKGEGGFYSELYVKLIIASNQRPSPAKRGQADLSRLIILKVEPSRVMDDGDWEYRLEEELGAFLYDCIKKYHEFCPVRDGRRTNKIPVPEVCQNLLEESADHMEENFEVMSHALRVDMNGKNFIEQDKLFKFFVDECRNYGMTPKDRPKFYEYLESKIGLKRIKDSKGVVRCYPVLDLIGENENF